jgi:hypothetical protein
MRTPAFTLDVCATALFPEACVPSRGRRFGWLPAFWCPASAIHQFLQTFDRRRPILRKASAFVRGDSKPAVGIQSVCQPVEHAMSFGF